MDQEPDAIKKDIDETRDSMTVKMQQLEDRVRGTVDDFKGAVDETVDDVKGKVDDTVGNVKQVFDFDHQMNERPWIMVGGAIAAGLVLGALLGGDDSHSHHEHRAWTPPVPDRERNFAPRHAEGPGVMDELGKEFDVIRTAAVHTIGMMVTDWLKDMVPQFGNELARAKGQTPRREALVPNGHAPERSFGSAQDAGYTGPGRSTPR